MLSIFDLVICNINSINQGNIEYFIENLLQRLMINSNPQTISNSNTSSRYTSNKIFSVCI